MITYKKQKDNIQSNKTNNLMIAAWTTSTARLRLLKALQAVVKSENSLDHSAVLLYLDTDSIIYAVREGFTDPLKFLEGPHLGELKDEKPDFEIREYCSCGAKNYAMRLKNIETGKEVYEMKIRGITLDYLSCQQIQYHTFKEKCLGFGKHDDEPIYIEYKNVLRSDVKTGSFDNSFSC
jgi:hypothetical protein